MSLDIDQFHLPQLFIFDIHELLNYINAENKWAEIFIKKDIKYSVTIDKWINWFLNCLKKYKFPKQYDSVFFDRFKLFLKFKYEKFKQIYLKMIEMIEKNHPEASRLNGFKIFFNKSMRHYKPYCWEIQYLKTNFFIDAIFDGIFSNNHCLTEIEEMEKTFKLSMWTFKKNT